MSYLIRTGNSRNNISWGGGTSTKAKYLRRTGTDRTSISWIDISSNSTVNVLERTASGRNNIRWYNTNFSFASWSTVKDLLNTGSSHIQYLITDGGYEFDRLSNPIFLNRYYNDYLTGSSSGYAPADATSRRSNYITFRVSKTTSDVLQSLDQQISQLKHISFLRRKMGKDYEFYTNISITDYHCTARTSTSYEFTISFASCDFKVENGFWQFGFKIDP